MRKKKKKNFLFKIQSKFFFILSKIAFLKKTLFSKEPARGPVQYLFPLKPISIVLEVKNKKYH